MCEYTYICMYIHMYRMYVYFTTYLQWYVENIRYFLLYLFIFLYFVAINIRNSGSEVKWVIILL